MGEWRYYAQRAVSKAWLDTNAQLADVDLTWGLSGPNSGKAVVPAGLTANPFAEDGQLLWGKWNTMLYAEEDGKLMWVGICSAVWPDGGDLKLEFVGFSGWLQRVPFLGDYSSWQVNVFDVVRMYINYAVNATKPYNLDIIPSTNKSAFVVGDIKPPAEPEPPARAKGQTMDAYQNSAAYKRWETADQAWKDTYGDYAKYSLGWWEGQYVGEEIDQLAKELDFEYRERVTWFDRNRLIPRFYFDMADDMVRRRDDIAFIDGMNLAKPIAPKDGNEPFANHIIGLGAGEGRSMVRVTAGTNDGRLYQAQFVNYKAVRQTSRLRSLVNADLRTYANKEYDIDRVVVWDVEGFSSISTLATGDEVKVQSRETEPAIDTWRRVIEIQRSPEQPYATLTLEYAS